jgi:hypothetical protein
MKPKIVFIVFFVFIAFLFSFCGQQKKITPVKFDRHYIGEENFHNFYIVDTIIIENPVAIWSDTHGGPFVMNKKKLANYHDELSFFFEPDVFILWPDIKFFASKDQYNAFDYSVSGGCTNSGWERFGENIWLSEYSEPPLFILGLVNANHYHRVRQSENYFSISSDFPKYFFVKIVFPYCNGVRQFDE